MGNFWSSITPKQSAPADTKDESTARGTKFNSLFYTQAYEKLQHEPMETFGCQPTSGVTTSEKRNETKKQERGIKLLYDGEKAVTEQIRDIGKWTKYFCREINRSRIEEGSVKRTKENLVDLQLYLLDVEGYLETVPHSLQQTKEYEKLMKRYNFAKQQCIDTEEWIEQKQKEFRIADERKSCRMH